jgi:hypothetical protein
MPTEPDPRRTNFGVPKMFLRWWPLWLILVIAVIALMSVVPAIVSGGPAIGTGGTGTAAQFSPGD